MPRYIVTDKEPSRLLNGTLKAGDEIEIENEAEAEFMKRLGFIDDLPEFPPKTQRAPQAAAVAPVTGEVRASADAEVIRATDQEVDPAPDVGSDRYERRDMRPEE